MDQSDPFESALSSIVSSPVASNSTMAGGESVVLRELIGRLGSICSSGEASNGNNSATTSCYTTPLNSPPKLNLSIMDHHYHHHQNHHHHHHQPVARNNQIPAPQFPTDPGFVERAARFSCFGGKEGGYPQGVASPDKRLMCLGQENKEMDGSMEESSVSEQIPGGETGIRGRKRKGIPKGKGKEKETQSSTLKVDQAEKEESDAKRSKSNEEGNGNGNQKQTKEKENAKPPEPPKDYIHVRARRGQATDSHSLAERVRREKISERMKFLQDLVPGCNKVTGKAVMLDEIINYVQSLQRQVEFLSMKLATVNPRVDVSMESLLSKDMFQPNSVDTSFPYGFQTIPDGVENPSSMNSLMAFMDHSSSTKLAHIDGFNEASAAAALWESDLQSVVQMGFGQDQPQSFHGTMGTSQMKVEL